MPRLNGKGPQEQGPMTGRKMGKCGGAKSNQTGFGLGRRCKQVRTGLWPKRCCQQNLTIEEEKAMLEHQKSMIEARLSELNSQES